MQPYPSGILKKIEERKQNDSFRSLYDFPDQQIDFSSNDYLGFARSASIFKQTSIILENNYLLKNGATGSRLISGNSSLYNSVENQLAKFHQSESCLLFNSGYDANLGLLSSVPQRNDLILFDELSHASIRDGIRLSTAKSQKFKHNNVDDLVEKIMKLKGKVENIFVFTESVFSMDGDSPDLQTLVSVCEKYHCFLIVDEAHAVGVFGEKGNGLIQQLQLEDKIFARVVTFGKAIGAHGAAVLGDQKLRDFLINYARSFIYTTALPPHSLATIYAAYQELETSDSPKKLQQNIIIFKEIQQSLGLEKYFIKSDSAIQSCVFSGNTKVKELSTLLAEKGFWVKAILAPTVPKDRERLRFCLHSFTTKQEMEQALTLLKQFV